MHNSRSAAFNLLMISDVHFDSPHCDRALLRKHLDQAVEAGAGIISIGDWFDAMQGKDDRRHQKADVRPELSGNDYIDRLVDESVKFLEPYKGSILMMGDGNHETSIIKHLETDLTGRLTRELGVNRMGYSGFVDFRFQVVANGKAGSRTSRSLYFHHGSGGGGPVTKGVIQTNRRAVYLPDASVVVSGHIHESWQIELPRVRLLASGRTETDTQLHVCLATYKDEFEMGGGWHVERGASPKPMGGAWLQMDYHKRKRTTEVAIKAIRAN